MLWVIVFYSYGDMPLEPTLESVNALALSQFEPEKELAQQQLPSEQRWSSPRRAAISVPADQGSRDDKPCTVSLAWVIPQDLSEIDEIGVRVVADLLLSGPEAAFYQPLVASGLGTGLAPGTGYAGSRREPSFAVGLKHVAVDAVEQVEDRIMNTLQKAYLEGFDLDRVDALVDARARSRSIDGLSCRSIKSTYQAEM